MEGTSAARGHLNHFIIGSVPTVFYIPHYVTAAEEERLLNNIYQAPVSKWKPLKNRRLQNWGGTVHEKGLLAQEMPSWLKQITNRICEESRLFPSAINHVLINEYLPDQGIMPHQDGPAYVPVVAILSLESPVVMDFTPHPSLNLNCTSGHNIDDTTAAPRHMVMDSSETMNEYRPFSVTLMPRSLLIFKDNAYSDYLHGIKDCEVHECGEAVNVGSSIKSHGQAERTSASKVVVDDVGTGSNSVIHRTGKRVSLTCRVVMKVHKNLIKL